MNALVIVFVAILILYITYTWIRDQKKLPLPPGPSFIECYKIMFGFIQREDIHIVGEELQKRYGEISRVSFMGQHLIFLNSNRLIRKLLATSDYREFTNDRPPTFLRDYIYKGPGNNIGLSDYSDQVVKLRKMVHGVVRLYGDGVREFEQMVSPVIDILGDQLTEAAIAEGKSYDMDKALTQSICRLLHVFLTSQIVKEDNIEHVASIIEDYNRDLNLSLTINNNLVLSMFPWLQHLPGPKGRLARSIKNTKQRLLNYFLDSKMKEQIKGNGSMIGTLLTEQDTDPLLTDLQLEGVILDVVAGGFITTKGALSGFFLLMMHYPEVQQRLQEELDEKLGSRKPSLDDRSELHYTNAVILECFRYIRHIPLGIPHLVKQDIEIDGYRIPANSTLLTNMFVTSRGDDMWVKPEIFNPDRYLDDNGKLLPIDHPIRHQFNPFSVGRRVCVGESFAKSRIFLYVTNLMQKIEFRRGGNELVSEDSSNWTTCSAFYPQFLNCEIVQRKRD